jgi:hypothetical protein
MIIKEKKVYYCEFCNKHSLASGSLKRHEERCTANPNRVCGMPNCSGIVSEELIGNLIKYAEDNVVAEGQLSMVPGSDPYTDIPEAFVRRMMEELECPWCTLTILRVASKRRPDLHIYWQMDFKAIAKEILDEVAEDNRYNY